MLKPWLKGTLQIAGTLALMALTVVVYRRTDWSKGFTPDGLMTLVAGVIAFIAVIIQIRSSSKQLHEQMGAQRAAQREEQERQKQSVATAILFEIDNFYRQHLGQVRDYLAAFERSKQLPGTVPVSAHGFVVYHGNASRLGDLPRELVGKMVDFYGMAEHYHVVREDYRERVESEAPQDQGVAQTQFQQLKNLISKLELSAYELSKELCSYLDLPFDPSVVEIAGTDVKTLEAQVAAIEKLQAAAMQQISAYAKKD